MDQNDRAIAAVWVQLMRIWRQSFLAASLLEIPLFCLLHATSLKSTRLSGLASILAWLHVIPLSIASFAFLRVFGHSEPPVGDAAIWYFGYWLFVFAGQIAVITLLIWAFAKTMKTNDHRKRQPI